MDSPEADLPQILHLAEMLMQLVGQGRLHVLPELLEAGKVYRGMTKPKLAALVEGLQPQVDQLGEVLSLELTERARLRANAAGSASADGGAQRADCRRAAVAHPRRTRHTRSCSRTRTSCPGDADVSWAAERARSDAADENGVRTCAARCGSNESTAVANDFGDLKTVAMLPESWWPRQSAAASAGRN